MKKYTGEIIRQYRIKSGLNQYELADVLGHSRQFQNKIEKGIKDLPISKVSKCCFLLNIPPEIMHQALIRGKMDYMRSLF